MSLLLLSAERSLEAVLLSNTAKRKRKRNLQKELKKKAKKASASTQSDGDECVTLEEEGDILVT